MPVPELSSLLLPLLRLTADGADHALSDLRERLQAELQLTEADLAERIAGGQSKFGNRVSWGAIYLCKRGALERVRQGVFHITEQGRELLQRNPEVLTLQEVLHTGHDSSKLEGAEQESVLATPEERLENGYQALRSALAEELLEAARHCTPAFFEKLVIDLLVAMGYGALQARGRDESGEPAMVGSTGSSRRTNWG